MGLGGKQTLWSRKVSAQHSQDYLFPIDNDVAEILGAESCNLSAAKTSSRNRAAQREHRASFQGNVTNNYHLRETVAWRGAGGQWWEGLARREGGSAHGSFPQGFLTDA